jgi:hypothetical protein
MQNAFIESFNGPAGLERDAVHVAGPGSRCPGMSAGRLQRRSTTLATWMEDAFRVRLHLPYLVNVAAEGVSVSIIIKDTANLVAFPLNRSETATLNPLRRIA